MKIEILNALTGHGVKRIEVTEKSFKDLESTIKDMFEDKASVIVETEKNITQPIKSVKIFGIEVYTYITII